MSTYAIISLGGKQYRVREGQRLLVDRLSYEESATFHPAVLFVGGDGKAEFSPKHVQVTARVVQNVLGDKIRIGKYRPKTGYRRHAGHRSRLTEVEITAVAVKPVAKGAGEGPAPEKAKADGTAEAKAEPKAAARKAPAPKASAETKAETKDGA